MERSLDLNSDDLSPDSASTFPIYITICKSLPYDLRLLVVVK